MMKLKKLGRKKYSAVCLSLILAAGSLTGCGGQDGAAEKLDGAAAPKGAYLEKEQPLTGIPEDAVVKQLCTVDDKIHLVTARENEEGITLQEWELQDDSFTEVTRPWLTDFVIPAED